MPRLSPPPQDHDGTTPASLRYALVKSVGARTTIGRAHPPAESSSRMRTPLSRCRARSLMNLSNPLQTAGRAETQQHDSQYRREPDLFTGERFGRIRPRPLALSLAAAPRPGPGTVMTFACPPCRRRPAQTHPRGQRRRHRRRRRSRRRLRFKSGRERGRDALGDGSH